MILVKLVVHLDCGVSTSEKQYITLLFVLTGGGSGDGGAFGDGGGWDE